MLKKNLTEEQIAFALRLAKAGTTIGAICRRSRTAPTRVAEATFYRWKKIHAGKGREPLCAIGPKIMASEILRLKQLE